MEVLRKDDVERERKGVLKGDLRWFPRAKPIKVLRIFRTKFNSLNEPLEEVKRVKIIERYLAPDHVAMSDEFLVDYFMDGKRDFILCGLQDYVEGEILDPWSPITEDHLSELFRRMAPGPSDASGVTEDVLIQKAQNSVEKFIKGVKKMILEANHVPDLAGVGNLILTPTGEIKLVDINNISKVSFESAISVDDKGYPVCDKSIEALSLLERKMLGGPINMEETLYKTFLDPKRMREVKALEEKFHLSMKPAVYPID